MAEAGDCLLLWYARPRVSPERLAWSGIRQPKRLQFVGAEGGHVLCEMSE